jgi:hypothetical protein
MATLAYGGLAGQTVAKEAETFAVPEGMPFEEAGAFPTRARGLSWRVRPPG